jgi:hypothetical protein
VRTDSVSDAEPAKDLHRPGVAAFHFRQVRRDVFAFDDKNGNAAAAQIYRESQADRTSPDDDHSGL